MRSDTKSISMMASVVDNSVWISGLHVDPTNVRIGTSTAAIPSSNAFAPPAHGAACSGVIAFRSYA